MPLNEINSKEINGKAVVIEFSRPGGHGRKSFNHHHHHPTTTTISKNAISLNFQPHSPPPPPPSPPLANRNTCRFSPLHSPCAHLPRQLQSLPRKTAPNLANGNTNTNLDSVNSVSLETTNLSGVVEEKQSKGPALRSAAVNNSSGEAAVGSTKQQPRSRNWKGKIGKKQESRFLIKEDAIVESSCKDSRTNVMIRSIPNKYRFVCNFLHSS